MLLALAVAGLEAKPIRLRARVIDDDPGVRTALGLSTEAIQGRPTTTGRLCLIQLTDSPPPQWRASLRSNGVVVLRYVPEDAYVARLEDASPATIAGLPFVAWVGQYRPEFKLHPDLSAQLQYSFSATGPSPDLGVSVLLAPGATAEDRARTRALFKNIHQESELNAGVVIRGKLSPGRLAALAQSDAVLWVEPWRGMKLFDEVSSKIVAGDGGRNRLYSQLLGWDGSGVRVAVADSGLNTGDAANMHPDLFGRTPVFLWYGRLTDAADEHGHGTHVAGIIAGDGATGRTDESGALYGLGVAPGAEIIVQRMFDGMGNYEPPIGGFEQLTREATRNGADIGSNSWGDDTYGRYDISAMEFDELVRDADALKPGDQSYILEFSAGNAGPGYGTIGSPAVAKNVIATGASQNARADLFLYEAGPDAMADFSSRGPCEDGRIKPDLVAPGTWIASLQSAAAGDQNAWLPIDDLYQYQGGTSQAGPHVSGAAALFVQYYRAISGGQKPSPALVKAALINSAVDMDDEYGTAPVPNMDEGWGRLDLTQLFDSERGFLFFDQRACLTTGETFEQPVVVAGAIDELKITLAYTDVPGNPAAIPALVNDLDLECVSPSGTLYKGNQFHAGQSIPNPTARDQINNVEAIHIPEPEPGLWLVRVRAVAIREDARRDTEEIDQDFALVVSGDLAEAGQGVLALDRTAYRAPDLIRIRLVDTDLAGQPEVTVLVTSSTEPVGEQVRLSATDARGAFAGTLATATGPAANDGRLQVNHGDIITARYLDTSRGEWIRTTASVDLVPPTLSDVRFTNSLGRLIVSWVTDEPATSIVRFGTNTALELAVTNPALVTEHVVELEGLRPGIQYWFVVLSSDVAGNTTTNDNSGALYSLVMPRTAPVLIVDDWQADILGWPPPLTGYTAVLDALGVDYDITIKSEIGPADLAPYRLVIWRISELLGGWTPAERMAISNYLHNGGALFVASMELLSRLEESGAGAFIRSVLHVQDYRVDGGSPPSTGASAVRGTPGGTVGAGIDTELDYSIYEDLWWGVIGPDLSDTITPAQDASPVFVNQDGDVVGLRWPAVGQTAPGRLVFLTFPLDAVPVRDGINDRIHLMRYVLNFLIPGWSTAPVLTLDSESYTIPAVVGITLGGSALAGAGQITVRAWSDSDTNGTQVLLLESVTPGVFTGACLLMPNTNQPAPGRLRAAHGDSIVVEYQHPNHPKALAVATVDTAPPTIGQVWSDVGYEDAVIGWDTTEPCDALVQYGESPMLGKTGFNPTPALTHMVTLHGLLPGKTYYYRVVSRDIAGNVNIDDNAGALYTFQTLMPITPPWRDDMETGATNWTVFDNFEGWDWFGGVGRWQLGSPANGLVDAPHSGSACWGVNLEGARIEFADCYLISPAIYLTGGNSAKLIFWHCYDFDPEELEAGTVYIATSDATAPTELRTYYADSTDGWVREELDLTPYLGRVVYLIWNYQLLALSETPGWHPGWLVDDVEVLVTNVEPGTIRITNNLWQARFVVYGPLNFRGRGPGTVLTNAPPGEYVAIFGDVPYYATPPPQTNTLTPGTEIVFQGTYTFADANNNSIPDEWELANFGVLDPARTHSTDTDGDGMPDLAEFLAGTDPNNPPPPFRIRATLTHDSRVNLSWASVPTRMYRVLASTNGSAWFEYSGWLTNAGTNISVVIDPPPGTTPWLFRVELVHAAGANAPPAALRLNAALMPDNQTIRLRWACAPDHAYRVLASTDLQTWQAVSDWIHPTAVSASHIVTLTNSGPVFFRLEVRP